LPAALVVRRALEHGNCSTTLQRGDRCRHAADAATRDYDIRCAACHDILRAARPLTGLAMVGRIGREPAS